MFMTFFYNKHSKSEENSLYSHRYRLLHKMKISTKLSAVVLAALAAVSTVSCEKPVSEPEDNSNSFTYEGNTYKIRSVVLYELENNMTQIWMSETAGYTTVDEIEASVGELVLTIPTGKIDNGKQSYEEKNVGNLIKYDGKKNSGWYTYTCYKDAQAKTITIDFSSQLLKSDADHAITGNYSGPYTEYTIEALNNQWAYNRQAKAIKSVDYFEMEDGEPSRVVIYDDNIPALDIYLTPENIGVPVLLGTADEVPFGTEVYFDDGEEFKLRNSYGSILIKPTANDISISLKLTNEGGKTLAAEYMGAYRHRYGNKTNRCIFDSGSKGYGYNGKVGITNASVSETSSMLTFKFTPGEHFDSGLVDMNQVPTLKVAREILNDGEIRLDEGLFVWEFYYHNFQVFSYDANTPDKPTASEGSVIEISRNDEGQYTVNLELTTMMKRLETRNKVDENGNIIYKEVVKKDEYGNPLLDENEEPIMEKVPETEQVEVEIPATMDLFFTQAN